MDRGAKHRLLLSLRAERAMGLRVVPKPSLPIIHQEEMVAASVHAPAQTAQRPSAIPPMATKSAVPTPSPRYAPPVMLSEAPFDSVVLSGEQKRVALNDLDVNQVRGCPKCDLCKTRTQTVFGEGDPDAEIFFIGEGPGENEDQTGRPFVGRAGQLLDKMIGGMGLKREDVFIANIVKCRPPNNRVPAPIEVETCTPYLMRQLEIVRPKVIVTLGRPSACFMLGNPKMTMGSMRGQWQRWRGIALMPTFHPSYVLRTYTEAVRAAVWDDLKAVLKELGREPPKRDRVG